MEARMRGNRRDHMFVEDACDIEKEELFMENNYDELLERVIGIEKACIELRKVLTKRENNNFQSELMVMDKVEIADTGRIGKVISINPNEGKPYTILLQDDLKELKFTRGELKKLFDPTK